MLRSVKYFLLFITIALSATLTKGFKFDYNVHNLTIEEITANLVDMFRGTNKIINNLKSKIDKINSYIVDNTAALNNVTKFTELNETNFFNALNENDHFTFLNKNDSQNLYLKLKAKMTRDDILKILATKKDRGKLLKSARRMLKDPNPKTMDEDKLNDVVDKILGEIPEDNHEEKANQSIYWDPQGELEDLKEYHEAKRNGRRIFKGEKTSIREYPFMASVHVMGRFWCGGVLYWHDLVLTSASCLQLMHNNRFFRENPRILAVRLGSNHSRIGGERIEVLEVYFHPSYNPKTLADNLAVLRLRRHLAFRYRIPRIIPISESPGLIPATAEITVLGWGVTKFSQKLAYEPIFLQKKVLPVYPNVFCKEVYGPTFITEKMFCAGTLTTGEGACDHDAGGPAILSGKLIGIISFGPAICGYENTPTVFTLVGAFVDWIETVNETKPGYYKEKVRTTSTTVGVLNDFFKTWKPMVKGFKSTQTTVSPITPLAIPIETKEAPTEPTEELTEVTEAETTMTTTTASAPPDLKMDESGLGDWSMQELNEN